MLPDGHQSIYDLIFSDSKIDLCISQYDEKNVNSYTQFLDPSYFHYDQKPQCFERHKDNKLLMTLSQKNDSNPLVMDDWIY